MTGIPKSFSNLSIKFNTGKAVHEINKASAFLISICDKVSNKKF